MLEVLDTNDISKYQELAKKIVLGDPSWKRDLLKVNEPPEVIPMEELKKGESYDPWESLMGRTNPPP
jgi:hypothetical protein